MSLLISKRGVESRKIIVLKASAVATSPTSYLQTLAKDEAIAFVVSLQTVKDHLSQALLWLETQRQQKALQLKGIETLLFEAEALGLVAAETHSILEATSAVTAATPTLESAGVTHTDSLGALPQRLAVLQSSQQRSQLRLRIAALPTKKTLKQSRGQQGKAASAKTSRDSKPSASTKTSTVPAKQANPSMPPVSKVAQRGKTSPLQRFLKSQWQDKALIEAVSDILNRATALSTDEVMAALYDGLPQADYDRAKHSLANTLSVGRSKGAWKSPGRGLYAGNAVTTN